MKEEIEQLGSERPFLTTTRLEFSLLRNSDFENVLAILSDIETMYAWEHGFTKEETKAWLEENFSRYKSDGYSYWAVRLKGTNEFIGMMGIMKEKTQDREQLGIGYIIDRKYWGNGYAEEGAEALLSYAFFELGLKEITAQIKFNNLASKKVAQALGMVRLSSFIKNYRGKEMPHDVFALQKSDWINFEGKQVVLIKSSQPKKKFLDLLLLGDEDENMIDRYLMRSELFILVKKDIVAVAAVTEEEKYVFEIKNLAVAPNLQGQGLGSYLLTEISRLYQVVAKTILVGTGDNLQTIGFYESNGFKSSHCIRNFFIDNYSEPIIENGKRLVDMIYLRKDFE